MMLYETYFYWSGVLLNTGAAIFVALCLWIWFIWPMIEAVSMCRWYAAIGKVYPNVKPKRGWVRLWWSCTEIWGRSNLGMTNKFGRWEGVGKWRVFKDESEK